MSLASQAHRSAAYCRSGGNAESPPAAVEEAGPDRPAVRGGTPPQVVSVTDVVNRKRADGSGTRQPWSHPGDQQSRSSDQTGHYEPMAVFI